MTEIKFTSLAEQVFERIESDILSGKYQKGKLLTELSLTKELNVSRTPIREAIRRLEQENLIKETSKGHVVCGITRQDICDIYDIRLKIEGIATAMCAKNIDEKTLNRLKENVELQEFYMLKREADKIKTADSEFHEIIYDSCGSEIYAAILRSLHKKVQMVRRASVSDSERARQAVEEHREIYSALLERNCELCQKLTEKHINNAKNSIMRLK